jgi:hypothetical protein
MPHLPPTALQQPFAKPYNAAQLAVPEGAQRQSVCVWCGLRRLYS